MYRLMTCGDAPNCTWTDLAMPNLAGVNCANTGRNLSNSNYRGLDEEEERLTVQYYGNVTSMQFTGSYYRCYTILRAPAILRHCFVDSLEIYTLTLCLADLCTV